jgi:hypothetical protein
MIPESPDQIRLGEFLDEHALASGGAKGCRRFDPRHQVPRHSNGDYETHLNDI